MRPRPHFRRLVVAAAAAVVSVLAVPGLSAAASAATQAPYYGTAAHSISLHAAGAASTACATSRPHSGTILYAGIKGGLGRLTIENGLSQDGVVVLVLGRSKAIGVYVRAHASTTVHNIKVGTYTIDFTTGSRFRVCTGRFTVGASYWRFDFRLPFVAPPRFTVATLTLQPVSDGNAPVNQISSSQFPAP